MKKLLCLFMALVLVLSVCTLSVCAQRAPHFYGDVNINRDIEITDATEVQRYLAHLTELSELSKALADVDADGKVAVMDATMIQMKVANLIPMFKQDDYGIYTYANVKNISTNFDSRKAMAGVPVEFTVDAYSESGNPLRYVLMINQEFVLESAQPQFTYTFDEAGEYLVDIVIYNKYDEDSTYTLFYDVVEKPAQESFIISGIHTNNIYLNEMDKIEIIAYAYGGEAPYEYSFELKSESKKQDYSDNNVFAIGKLPLGEYEVNVSVKDASGDVVQEVYTFEVEELRVG